MIYNLVFPECTSRSIPVLSLSTTTSGVKVSSTSCFNANKPITLYNHFNTISAGSSLWALYPFSVMINPLDAPSIRMLVPLVFAKISSMNCLFLTFVAFIWNELLNFVTGQRTVHSFQTFFGIGNVSIFCMVVLYMCFSNGFLYNFHKFCCQSCTTSGPPLCVLYPGAPWNHFYFHLPQHIMHNIYSEGIPHELLQYK